MVYLQKACRDDRLGSGLSIRRRLHHNLQTRHKKLVESTAQWPSSAEVPYGQPMGKIAPGLQWNPRSGQVYRSRRTPWNYLFEPDGRVVYDTFYAANPKYSRN
jgi:hypothetical protein